MNRPFNASSPGQRRTSSHGRVHPRTARPTAPRSSAPSPELQTQDKAENEVPIIHKQGPYSDIDTGNYSDFKVKCSEKTFKLHRVVVCTQSEWFAAALTQGTIASTTGMISLPEEDPRIFAKLLQLLYAQELKGEVPVTKVLDLVKLYVMAIKFRCSDAAEMAYRLAAPALRAAFTGTISGSDAAVANEHWLLYTESIKFLDRNVVSGNDRLRVGTARGAAAAWRFLHRSESQVFAFLKEVPTFATTLASSAFLFRTTERSHGGAEEVAELMKRSEDSLPTVKEPPQKGSEEVGQLINRSEGSEASV